LLSASDAEVKSGYAAFTPRLSVDLSFTREGERTNEGSRVTNAGSYGAGLSANLNLFNGFADWHRLSQAQKKQQQARWALAIARARASAELKAAFSAAFIAKRSVELSEVIANRRKQNADLIRLRYETGNENKGSSLLASTYYEEAKLDLLRAKQESEAASAQLAKVLGLEEGEGLEVTGELPLTAPPSSQNFQELLATLPEQQQARLEEEVQSYNVEIAKSAYYPSLNLIGTVGRGGLEFFPNDERWSVGLVLSFPLFGGGRDHFALQAARANAYASAYARESTTRQLLVQLKQAHANFVQAEARTKLARSFLDAARLRSEIGRARYNNGLLKFEEWDIIENELVDRERSLLTTQRDRVSAEATWEQILGKGAIP
jgi:outer membrane protein TolC